MYQIVNKDGKLYGEEAIYDNALDMWIYLEELYPNVKLYLRKKKDVQQDTVNKE